MGLKDRISHAYNAFMNKDPTTLFNYRDLGVSYSTRPDRIRLNSSNERTIINTTINKIAIDVAGINIKHVRVDEEDQFTEVINSRLNNCFALEANLDQTSRAFFQDVATSMMDEGVVAIVPTETYTRAKDLTSFDVGTMRTGKIIEWYPKHVRIEVYNQDTGKKESVLFPKNTVAIIENPFYTIMNERNSTLQRLIRKLNLLDIIDEQSSADKLNLIIQLPYVVKSTLRKEQAEARRQDIEKQLTESKYGVAYTDGTERITQLNRPLENKIMEQVKYLTDLFFSQLGISQAVLDGTADEKTMENYFNRIIEPIISAIVDEMKRKFLTKTARSQGQSIKFFRDPFKLLPVTEVATIADTFTRNEIMTTNEVRQKIGMKPSKDPSADELRNKNLSAPTGDDSEALTPEIPDESQPTEPV